MVTTKLAAEQSTFSGISLRRRRTANFLAKVLFLPKCRTGDGSKGSTGTRDRTDAQVRISFARIVVVPALLVLFGVLCLSGFQAQAATYVPASVVPPQPMREMRAAWVATVANIDWPSTNGLSAAQQKAELLAILDRAVQLKLNTIIFQVRPACDAMYASSFEPWSEYLSGVMGKPPEPFYDPLAFAVEEAHRRGLELHAWFNPYRARHIIVRSPVCSSHISKTRPELVRQYGKYLWLDPGEQAVQDYSLKVVMDVVQRYDIDGVHFDDYFYPYKEKDGAGREVDFPDNASWNRFGRNGKLDREDWRRENVNQFIQRAYKSIKTAKPWVKFGISPFGIWRPKNPPQIQGYDAFGKLYADARKWLENGWLDYCAPQLYWGINPPEQSFPVLLSWWGEQNKKHRHLMPGMDSTKTSGRWQPQEIVNQIRITRQKPGVNGHIHWNMKSLLRNPALGEALQREVYAQPALIPALTWVSRATPEKPKLRVANSGNSLAISWGCSKPEKVSRWVLQTRVGKTWITEVLPSGRTSLVLERRSPDFIALTAVDRFGNTSRPAAVQRKESVPIPSPKG